MTEKKKKLVTFNIFRPTLLEYSGINRKNQERFDFKVKSRLLCKMLYNVFTISTYQN
ncbi:hypothetical protein M6K037_2206 [Staphylococcus aureus]|nr:hypothetical protein M1K037_2226 [Staphylococcus aureus]GBY19851.1 hypothetical protein M6K037_2206 [Staphylococcus aureus]GBZ37526.1 hypothetical protein M6K139_2232 [Staphylococcus aureus]